MEHQGEKLRRFTKVKGWNIKELSIEFGLTRAAIEKHFNSPIVSRKVLKHYANLFHFEMEDFYEKETFHHKEPQRAEQKEITALQKEIIQLHKEKAALQSAYLNLYKKKLVCP